MLRNEECVIIAPFATTEGIMSFSSANSGRQVEPLTTANTQGFGGEERLPTRTQEGALNNCPCRVLIVDDNAAAVKMLSLMMKLLGKEVRTAEDGQQGVEIAAEFLPDLMLMDFIHAENEWL
jgi:PleD family two-component response regulator